jgi:glycosyltransferase involved in cell wall biosynthesis
VGRLCEQKGQLLLIEVASRLAKERVDFELVLVGDGEMRRVIETQIARAALDKHVHITGWLTGAQVQDEIRAARSLVLPSFAEGLPVVLMEAMALRRPVISTYVGGIPELVQPSENGWLSPAGDTERLLEIIKHCLDAPDHLLRKMGDAAVERVLVQHNIDCEATKLAELISTFEIQQ